jgi:serine/threonine protein phosphatase 1
MGNHLFTYAVGDLNGDHGLLTALLDRIHQHAGVETYRLVFLGNTIDGGSNPAAVLSALRAIELRAPDRVVILRGWHEGLMAKADTPEGLAAWMQQGGAATLRSFGVTRLADVPREVLDWIGRRPSEWRDGLRRYVGDPERVLQAKDGPASGLHVVHGASFIHGRGGQDKPREAPGITDIDTGAGLGGPLTAAIFTDLQAEPAGYFQALPGGETRFLPPQQPNAAIREPRRALRMLDGEPETAAAWSLRQDAEIIAAQLANQKRSRRRRVGFAMAAGLVLLVGAGALLARPAQRYVADLLSRPLPPAVVATNPAAPPEGPTEPSPAAPTMAAPASPEPANEGGTAARATAASADAPPDDTAQASAPAAPETVRTHALPAEPLESPAVTGATSPAPAPAVAAPLAATPASLLPSASPPPAPAEAQPPVAPAPALPPAQPEVPASREAALGSAAPLTLPADHLDKPAETVLPPALPGVTPTPAAKPAAAKPSQSPAGAPATAKPTSLPKPKAAAKPPAPRPVAAAPRAAPARPTVEPAESGAGPIDLQALIRSPQAPVQAAPAPVRRAAPARPARAARAPKPPADLETQSVGGGLD